MKIISSLPLMIATAFLLGNSSVTDAFSHVGTSVKNAFAVSGIQKGPCSPNDCEVLVHNGSRLTIFGGIITRQRYIRSEAGKRLPFALARVTNRDRVLKIIHARTGVILILSKQNVYDGVIKLSDGTNAILYVKLHSNGKVDEIGITIGETG